MTACGPPISEYDVSTGCRSKRRRNDSLAVANRDGRNYLARAGLPLRPVAERGRRCIMREAQLGASVVGRRSAAGT
jgi:hypothetical protein